MTAAKIPLDKLPAWPALLQLSAAAAYLQVSPTTFTALIRGEVRVIRHGSLTLYSRTDLDRWIEKRAKTTLEVA
jgi:excisionase family DNA binding protein